MRVSHPAQEIRYFFYSQAFTDGLRMTFAILLPALLGSYFNQFEAGMTLSLGAFCVSLTDAPGPIIHKRNGMLICIFFTFLVAVITPLARVNTIALTVEIAVFCFFFSMFIVYGVRAGAIGTAALLVMILTMDEPIHSNSILLHSLLILTGGTWYFIISILLNKFQPYRPAQRILGDSIREVARYLALKAPFYHEGTDMNAAYRKLVAQQITVHEKQELVREILFKTRQIVQESTPEGRKLVITFIETIDIFEDITAAYYDYTALHRRFAATGALEKIAVLIEKLSIEMSRVGIAIQMNTGYKEGMDLEGELVQLKKELDALPRTEKENNLVLKKILVNLRKLVQRHKQLTLYFSGDVSRQQKKSLDHSRFVSHQSLDPKIFWNNLNFKSAVFKYALRVSIACTTGYILTKLIAYGEHSYWVLLTIAFILKPAFSLTKKRNIERIIGTVIGGSVGVAILLFIPNKNVQFAFMVVFMLGNYTFLRLNYLVMVLFTTPFVLILFHFLGLSFLDVAQERLFDTVLGCAIAFSASYFLFPTWESEQVSNFLQQLVKANTAYLKKLVEGLKGKEINLLEYKLARKEVYVQSANLSSAFQRMLSEPAHVQMANKKMHQFVVLNHILSSNIATMLTGLLSKEPKEYPSSLRVPAKKAVSLLQECCSEEKEVTEKDVTAPIIKQFEAITLSHDEVLMKDQLEFIQRIAGDIKKTYKEITG